MALVSLVNSPVVQVKRLHRFLGAVIVNSLDSYNLDQSHRICLLSSKSYGEWKRANLSGLNSAHFLVQFQVPGPTPRHL